MTHPTTMRAWIRMTIGVVVLAAWVVLAGGALAANSPVTIAGFALAPATVTVAVGDTVTWTNGDAAPHTATAVDGSFDTGAIATGKQASFTFTKPGTYRYRCTFQSRITGTVVVRARSTFPATDAAPAGDGSTTPDGGPTVAVLGLLAAAGLLGTILARRRLATARH